MGNFKSRVKDQPQRKSTVDVVPCEFCSKLYDVDDIVLHQSKCRPDLLHYGKQINPEDHLNHGVENAVEAADLDINFKRYLNPSVENAVEATGLDMCNNSARDVPEIVPEIQDMVTTVQTTDLVPCEFCSELYSIEDIVLHQSKCRPDLLHGSVCTSSCKASESYISINHYTRDSVYQHLLEKQATTSVEDKQSIEETRLRSELDLVPCVFCTEPYCTESITLHELECSQNTLPGQRNFSEKCVQTDIEKSNIAEIVKQDNKLEKHVVEIANSPTNQTIMNDEDIGTSKSVSESLIMERKVKSLEIEWVEAKHSYTESVNFLDKIHTAQDHDIAETKPPAKATSHALNNVGSVNTSLKEVSCLPGHCVSLDGNNCDDSTPCPLNKDCCMSSKDILMKSSDEVGSCFKPVSPSDIQNNESSCFKHSNNVAESSHSLICLAAPDGNNASAPQCFGVQNVKDCSKKLVDTKVPAKSPMQNTKVCRFCATTVNCFLLPVHESNCKQKLSYDSSKFTIKESQPKTDSNLKQQSKMVERVVIQAVPYELTMSGKCDSNSRNLKCSEWDADWSGKSSEDQCCSLDSRETSECAPTEEQFSNPVSNRTFKCGSAVDQCSRSESNGTSECASAVDQCSRSDSNGTSECASAVDQCSESESNGTSAIDQGSRSESDRTSECASTVDQYSKSETNGASEHISAVDQCSKSESNGTSECTSAVSQCSTSDTCKVSESEWCDLSIGKQHTTNESKYETCNKNTLRLIPCEFCSRLFYNDFIAEHQSGCRPDLLHFDIESEADAPAKSSNDHTMSVEADDRVMKENPQAADICNDVNSSEADSQEYFECSADFCSKFTDLKTEFKEPYKFDLNQNSAFQDTCNFTNDCQDIKIAAADLIPCEFCSRLFSSNFVSEHQSSCRLDTVECEPKIISDCLNNNSKSMELDMYNQDMCIQELDIGDCVIDSKANFKEVSNSASVDVHDSGTECKEISKWDEDLIRASVDTQCSGNDLMELGMQLSHTSTGVQCSRNDLPLLGGKVCCASVGVQCFSDDLINKKLKIE